VEAPVQARQDQLQLLFTCCAASLPERTRVCLALRSLVGLTTRQIARAWLEAPPTTAQRLVRAHRKLREEGPATPSGEARAAAIDAVNRTLYLLFNEGYLPAEGDRVVGTEVIDRALDLVDRAATHLPFHAETHGLAALCWLHASRSGARTDAAGDLVRLADQDRTRWDHDRIAKGEALLARAIELRPPGRQIGPYVLQAAIASLHCAAERPEDTDWLQIAALYRRLVEVHPSPLFELKAAMALAESGDVPSGLAWLNALERRGVLADYHLFAAAKADLHRRLGHRSQARRYLGRARRLAQNDAERRLLTRRIASLDA
jgi:RNA polymerase sigma-70 factor (ECF subfamily)